MSLFSACFLVYVGSVITFGGHSILDLNEEIRQVFRFLPETKLKISAKCHLNFYLFLRCFFYQFA